MGDDLPDRSDDGSERSFECASSTPVALVFDEPTAGAAFCPSVFPTCNRLKGRKFSELAVETIDSVGLPGRSGALGRPVTPSDEELGGPGMEGSVLRESRVVAWPGLSEDADPPMVVSLRRRSSEKGAPPILWSILGTRLIREGGPRIGV